MNKGTLHKMDIRNIGSENQIKADYFMILNNEHLPLNSLIGKNLNIHFAGRIYCIKCGRKTSKSFGQGYCYPCFTSAPETEECVLRPELCKAHLGEARDMAFAKEHCLIDHFVYLAWSGGLKVGVTRYHQIPTRWLDQGATKAIKVCRSANRNMAGLVEVELKKILADKTNWQAMLKGLENSDIDLRDEKAKAIKFLSEKSLSFTIEEDVEYTIQYPIQQYPEKVKSFSFDKEPTIEGTLTGIKGQYLIIDNSRVLNVRTHSGYEVEIDVK